MAYDIQEYKSKIMTRIVNIPEILSLINNKNIVDSDGLRNTHVFSRIKIPKTPKETDNYICFNLNSRTWNRNTVLKNFFFDVVIMCHEANISTKYGNRHDTIAGIIVDDFSWSNFLGFELEPVSDLESTTEEFCIRTLTFQNKSPNSLSNGVKMDGY